MPHQPLTCSLILAMIFAAPMPSEGADDPAALCLAAATEAADASGVPYPVLLAIMLVETGRGGRPWPWTVNLAGDGHWLDSANKAVDLAALALEKGATNIDLGCFQLNHRWHGDAFPSLADMLDPWQNATYAAEHLARKHAETGDWALAAAAYHSSTPEHATRYLARFETVLAGLEPLAASDLPSTEPGPRAPNRFPLLMGGEAGRNGSLVPATAGGLRLIGGS